MARPRSISREDSLERALLLFWERGYDRTSIADLSQAIGVGPSSIYNSFGSKEDLFRQALDRYVDTYAAPALKTIETDEGEGPVDFVSRLMREVIKLNTTRGRPFGCAIFQTGGPGAPESSTSCAITNEVKGRIVSALRKRFEAYSKAGEELSSSPKTLAQFIACTLRGIAQLAADGTSRADLVKVADHAARSCAMRG